MRAFVAFLKKEWLEALRSGKLLILLALFFAFGVMNPAIAKLTPWLMELMAEELAESGLTVGTVTVDALTSWTQFFKNIPMALIALILLLGGTLTREYESGTLILLLTKGLARYKVILAKATVLFSFWTGGYFLTFLVTYAYNAYFWDNSIAVGLLPAVLYYWIFGLFAVLLTVLFSTIAKSYGGVLLGTGGSVLALYLIGLIPKLADYTPTALMNVSALLIGGVSAGNFAISAILTALLSIAAVAAAIPIFRKRIL